MKKVAPWVLTLILVFTTTGGAFARDDAKQEIWYQQIQAGGYDIFTNYVDGYSLEIDSGTEVDMSWSKVGTFFETPDKRMEIYRQYVGENIDSYLGYSNGFLANTKDHQLVKQGWEVYGENHVYVTRWIRPVLAQIQGDRNHYVVLDFPAGEYCYTVVIKTEMPIEQLGGYESMVKSFTAFHPYQEGKNQVRQAIPIEEKKWNEETKQFFQKYFGPDSSLTWGLYEPQTNYDYGTGTYDFGKVEYYEALFQYEFPVVLNYSEFENKTHHPNLKKRLDQAWEKGKVLELTLQTTQSSGQNQVYQILQGEYDLFLMDYAKTIKDFGHPVLFRLANEMNGDWCPYSGYHTSRDPEIYQEFYRYVYHIFEEVGVENVIYIWNPNSESFPNFKWNHSYRYYPGDFYVDVVGMTAYNTGTYYWQVGERWTTFSDLYQDLYEEYTRQFQQPLMITEFGSASMGGDKGQWIQDMFSKIYALHEIKMAIWWDGHDFHNGVVSRNYTIYETPEILEIFRQHFDPPWYRNAFA
jgi:hypothetical protein